MIKMAEAGEAKTEYNVSNPHPGYGKDPNIVNEFGHTYYPKWVKGKEGEQILVNSPMEESQLAAEPAIPEAFGTSKKAAGWGKDK
jgi:hypothetical protein